MAVEPASVVDQKPTNPKKPRKPRKRKLPRGVIWSPQDRAYYAQYFCAGCPKHAPTLPRQKRRHRECAGTAPSLARDLHTKRKNEIREGRFFGDVNDVKLWDPLFANQINDYLRRNASTIVNLDGAQRYARYWKAAPETKGKTMRQLVRADAQGYRERRRKEGAPGARRQRGGGSESTLNKELSFARAVYNDFVAQLEDRIEQGQVKAQHNPIPRNPFAERRRGTRKLYYTERPTRFRHLGSQAVDEADRLFAALPDLDAKGRVLAAVLSGVERGPMFAWTWAEDIDFVTRKVRGWRRKGDGTLYVYWVDMNPDLERLLHTIEAEQVARFGKRSRWVFPNATNTGPDNGDTFVRTVFRPALLRAGIDCETITTETRRVRAGKGYREITKRTPHVEHTFRWKDLRHTFASWLRQKGVGLDSIGALLGHRPNSRMTGRYAHLTADMKRTDVERLSGMVTIH